MTNLIIASQSKDAMQSWVRVLQPVYSVVLSEDIDTLFVESTKYDDNVLLVLDVSLISELHPLSQICQQVKKVIVVGDHLTSKQQIQLVFDGASGYSEKSIDSQLILRAIEGVINNEIWLERQLIPQVLKGVVAKKHSTTTKDKLDEETYKALSILTRREVEIIEHIYNGEDNLTISNSLHISIRTVKAHLTAIFRKLEVHDRFQLVVYLKDLHVDHLSNEQSSDEIYHLDQF